MWMTVFVVISVENGLIGEVKVYLSRDGADQAQCRWLRRSGIKTDKETERLTDQGSGIAVLECEIRP